MLFNHKRIKPSHLKSVQLGLLILTKNTLHPLEFFRQLIDDLDGVDVLVRRVVGEGQRDVQVRPGDSETVARRPVLQR